MKELLKRFKMGAKGQLAQLPHMAIMFGVFILVVAVMAIVLGEFTGTQTENSSAWNISTAGSTALLTWSDFFTVIAVAIIAGAIILILLSVFGGMGGGRGRRR